MVVQNTRPFSRSLESPRDVHELRDCPGTAELRPNLRCRTLQALAKFVVGLEHLVQLSESVRHVTLSTRSEPENHGNGTLQRPI